MTAFEFMANAFFAAVGVTCLSFAVLVVVGVAAGIKKTLNKKNEA